MTDLASESSFRTRTRFLRELQRIEQDVLRMGALVENSCWIAHTALFERNLDNATRVKAQDKEIDRFYKQIEQDCINLIALESPVARDLRLLSAFMQLVRDLERIGDYAENLCEIAVKFFPYPLSPFMDRVQTMSNRCRAMLALSLSALANLDAESGADIKRKDDAVDADYQALYRAITSQPPPAGTLEPVALMVLAIHHLERMADHATNIGQRVSYIVTGRHN